MPNIEETVAQAQAALSTGRVPSERALDHAAVLPTLRALGWDSGDIDQLWPEYAAGTGRVDWALCADGKPKVFLEEKAPSESLSKHEEQLLKYSFQQGVSLAVLTNGKEWWMYFPIAEGEWRTRRFATIDLFSQSLADACAALVRYLQRDRVCSDEARDAAREALARNAEAADVRLTQVRQAAEALKRKAEYERRDPTGIGPPPLRDVGGRSGPAELKLAYWTAFRDVFDDSPGRLVAGGEPQSQAWYCIGMKSSNFYLAAHMRPDEINVQLNIKGGSRREHFDALVAQRAEIEAELGSLEWDDRSKIHRVILHRNGVNTEDRADWSAQHQWLRETLKNFDRVFRPKEYEVRRRS